MSLRGCALFLPPTRLPQFAGTYRDEGESAAKRHGFLQQPRRLCVDPRLDFTCQEPCAGAPFGTVALATTAFSINANGLI